MPKHESQRSRRRDADPPAPALKGERAAAKAAAEAAKRRHQGHKPRKALKRVAGLEEQLVTAKGLQAAVNALKAAIRPDSLQPEGGAPSRLAPFHPGQEPARAADRQGGALGAGDHGGVQVRHGSQVGAGHARPESAATAPAARAGAS